MEVYVLTGVVIFLIAFIVFKEILQYVERHELTRKLMARNFVEYTNANLQQEALKKEPKKKESRLQAF